MAFSRAQEGGSVLLQRDIFKEMYGWTITPGPWGEWFNPMEIGLAEYRRATVAVAKAITRLCKHGLLSRGERRGHLLLTPEGYRQAQALTQVNTLETCAPGERPAVPPSGGFTQALRAQMNGISTTSQRQLDFLTAHRPDLLSQVQARMRSLQKAYLIATGRVPETPPRALRKSRTKDVGTSATLQGSLFPPTAP
jgi:hypothetical protein